MQFVQKLRTRMGAVVGALVASFMVPGLALAQTGIDTTEALAAVADAKTFITTVGIAVLAMIFVAKGIKWARRAG